MTVNQWPLDKQAASHCAAGFDFGFLLPPNIDCTDDGENGLPRSFTWPCLASSDATSRSERFAPFCFLRRSRLASATTSGWSSAILFLPSHLIPAARLRSRATFNLATSDAFSNCAIAPKTWRTRTAVGVSSVKKSGAVAGMSVTPSDLRKSWPASCTAR